MRTWSRHELLELWERGATRHPLDRGLLLLASAHPEQPLQTLADVPIGNRDHALLMLRQANFGRQLLSLVDCPSCGTRLELALDAQDLSLAPSPVAIEVAGLHVRPPTSRDLALALRELDEAAAERCLAERCIVGEEGAERTSATLDQLHAIEDALRQADAGADLVLEVVCDACGQTGEIPFDIASYLWQEIDASARRLLQDVHVLAAAYGWTERDVLALSDERRAAYLAMVTA